MKLSYRGVKYESKVSAVATEAGDVVGKYRGVELRAQVSRKR